MCSIVIMSLTVWHSLLFLSSTSHDTWWFSYFASKTAMYYFHFHSKLINKFINYLINQLTSLGEPLSLVSLGFLGSGRHFLILGSSVFKIQLETAVIVYFNLLRGWGCQIQEQLHRFFLFGVKMEYEMHISSVVPQLMWVTCPCFFFLSTWTSADARTVQHFYPPGLQLMREQLIC